MSNRAMGGGRLLVTTAVTVLTLVVMLAGWWLMSGGSTTYQSEPQAATAATEPLSESKPVSIDIPSIGARSSLIELGLDQNKALEVPPVTQPMQAGWYEKGPTPGEAGPAVIAGHVDGNKQKGIFYKLNDLEPGDIVNVEREDGTTARFAVQRVEQFPKSNFPTEEVYGKTPDAQLRLITCGGSYDSKAHSYRDNIIVFANLVE